MPGRVGVDASGRGRGMIGIAYIELSARGGAGGYRQYLSAMKVTVHVPV